MSAKKRCDSCRYYDPTTFICRMVRKVTTDDGWCRDWKERGNPLLMINCNWKKEG